MTINCTFKLAYTSTSFTKSISSTVTLKKLKDLIKNDVLITMNASSFNIIVAGTRLKEENYPLDCTSDSITLDLINRSLNSSCVFYIKKIDTQINNTNNIFSNTCPICYDILVPIETITLGCNHRICRSCISTWYRTGVTSCPCCRS